MEHTTKNGQYCLKIKHGSDYYNTLMCKASLIAVEEEDGIKYAYFKD